MLYEVITKRNLRPVRALILTPTRELAIQISESFREYGKHTGLTQAVVYGGVSQVPQERALREGVDILVATPGRLLRITSYNVCYTKLLRQAADGAGDAQGRKRRIREGHPKPGCALV